MPVTIKEVAKLAEVSPSTVSRVIAGSDKISDLTKDKVYKAMKELEYTPNAIARSLANRSTKTLGLILPNTEEDLFVNPFFIQAMRGISLYAQSRGYYIMYTYSDKEQEEVEFIEKFINSKWVDGVILLTAREDDKCISYLKKRKHPFVVIGRPENTEGVLWVNNDNFKAMYNVVSYLIQKGNREVAFIGGNEKFNVTRDRFEGYKKALENRGIPIDSNMIQTRDFTEFTGYVSMKKILEYKIPDAVVTTDDMIALGVLKAVNEIPNNNISVVGFNNTILGSYQKPSLTSVDIKAEELGYHAAELLINKLEIKNNISSYIVDTELIERESTTNKG